MHARSRNLGRREVYAAAPDTLGPLRYFAVGERTDDISKVMSDNALQDDDAGPTVTSATPSVMVERLRIVRENTPEARAERDESATAQMFARLGKRHPWTEEP